MSNKSIDRICKKLFESSRANLGKIFAVEAIVDEIDVANGFFVIKSTDSDNRIRCISGTTNQDLASLRTETIIRIMGKIEFLTTAGLEVIINVEHFCIIDPSKSNNDAMSVYQHMHKSLLLPKVQNHLNNFYKIKRPQMVHNIGLITLKNSTIFVDKFNESCVGNLYVYQVSPENIDYDIINAFCLFGKYYQIDMVCIVLDNITASNTLRLSSRGFIGKIINRKNYPYLTTCLPNTNKISVQPLLNKISNHKFDSVQSNIEFIQKIQTDFKKQLNNYISECKTRLRSHITNFKNKLSNLEAETPDVYKFLNKGINVSSNGLTNSFIKKSNLDSIRGSLLIKLKEQLIVFNSLERLVARSLIDAQRNDMANVLQKLEHAKTPIPTSTPNTKTEAKIAPKAESKTASKTEAGTTPKMEAGNKLETKLAPILDPNDFANLEEMEEHDEMNETDEHEVIDGLEDFDNHDHFSDHEASVSSD